MYLKMLKSKEIKLAFLEIAYLLSVCDVKQDGEEYDEVRESDSISGSVYGDKVKGVNKLKQVLVRKTAESAMLRMYAEEMDAFGIDNDQNYVRDDYENKIAYLIDDSIKRFLSVNETTNEKILNTQSIRTEFILETIDNILEEIGLESVSPEERKVIVFELVGMAYADNEISDAELNVIEHVCNRFDIDNDFIDESKEIVYQMVKLQRQGLELIEE